MLMASCSSDKAGGAAFGEARKLVDASDASSEPVDPGVTGGAVADLGPPPTGSGETTATPSGTDATTEDEGTTATTEDEGTTATTEDEGTTATAEDEGTTATAEDEGWTDDDARDQSDPGGIEDSTDTHTEEDSQGSEYPEGSIATLAEGELDETVCNAAQLARQGAIDADPTLRSPACLDLAHFTFVSGAGEEETECTTNFGECLEAGPRYEAPYCSVNIRRAQECPHDVETVAACEAARLEARLRALPGDIEDDAAACAAYADGVIFDLHDLEEPEACAAVNANCPFLLLTHDETRKWERDLDVEGKKLSEISEDDARVVCNEATAWMRDLMTEQSRESALCRFVGLVAADLAISTSSGSDEPDDPVARCIEARDGCAGFSSDLWLPFEYTSICWSFTNYMDSCDAEVDLGSACMLARAQAEMARIRDVMGELRCETMIVDGALTPEAEAARETPVMREQPPECEPLAAQCFLFGFW